MEFFLNPITRTRRNIDIINPSVYSLLIVRFI